jgi:hypothetical protein
VQRGFDCWLSDVLVRVADGSLDVSILIEVLPAIMGDRIDSDAYGQLRCRRFGLVPGLSDHINTYTNHTICVCVEVAKANRSPSIGILLSASYNSPRHPLNS